MRKLFKALLLVRRCDKGLFRRNLLYVVLQSILPLVSLYLLGVLVDTVSAGAADTLVEKCLPCVAGMVGVFLAGRVVAALSAVNKDMLSQRLVDYMADIMQHQASTLDLAYYDTPQYHDTMHRAQQEASFRPLQIMNNFMALFGAVISASGVVAMLVSASWLIVATMIVAVLPAFAVRLYKARTIYRFRRDNTQLYRQTAYYGALLSARDYAKEIRAFNLTNYFRRRFVGSRRTLVRHLLRISRRIGLLAILCAVIEAAAMLLVVMLLIRQTAAATITVGTFVMLFEAFRRGQTYMGTLVAAVAALYDNRLFVTNLFDFLQLRPTVIPPEHPQPLPEKIETIELRDVTFRYPEMQHDVLTHYNLTARVGEPLFLKGENGIGKTTTILLILRLYDPQQGAVLLNGIDIRQFDPTQLRRKIGVIFQDFVRYNLTVAENIAFDHPLSTEGCPLPGLQPIIDSLPKGWNSLLGRLFDGGAELSMGQWQRVATARALHTDAPILLLDEPAAWLDSSSRESLDQTIEQIKKDKIIIIITHQ